MDRPPIVGHAKDTKEFFALVDGDSFILRIEDHQEIDIAGVDWLFGTVGSRRT
ncbi:MAG: hypothetical protein ACLQUY_23010 [Ktedonobacterales bacterium]